MLTPSDLGLPTKFTDWRNNQLGTAARISATSKYAFLLDSPTGTGKSIIGAAVQKLMGVKARYICTTKQLQDQLISDFPYAATVKGRVNYRCLKYPKMFPQITAEDCTHKESNMCEYYGTCPYIVAKNAALASPLAILNTAYFMSEVNYIGAFSDSDLVIVDEFDTLEDQLMSFIEVVITQKQLDSIGVNPPKYKTKYEAWIEWANSAIKQLSSQLRDIEQYMTSDWALEDFKLLKKIKRIEKLLTKLMFFVNNVDNTWIWYQSQDRWVFKPVWVSKFGEYAFWRHAKKIFGMSATILDVNQVCANVGLYKPSTYMALPSPFPKENRPVYYQPVANVTNRLMDVALPRLARALNEIMEKHPNDRILVHTVSYKVRDYLRKKISSKRLVTHGTQDRAMVLEMFKKTQSPLVLLSPSMDRGVDLPGDECRVVVIAKVPYPDLGDPQVSRRVYGSKDGDSWYAHKTISTVVQMSGRAVRSESDHAITYILDEQFDKILSTHRKMFPEWFKEAIVS